MGQLSPGAQEKLLDMPAGQFHNKAGAMDHLLRRGMRLVKAGIQQKFLDIHTGQCQAGALDRLLTRRDVAAQS
jgi:hypothetical protein